MNVKLLLSPAMAFLIFLGLLSLVYYLLNKRAVKGPDHPEKHLPYSGGQDIPSGEVRLSYESFFRICLLFGIAHVAVLVLATLSIKSNLHWPGVIFLAGILISIFSLTKDR
jgi:NADH:ubiquinone oxidoreductase subunit 3 (subunit A)